MNTEARIAWVGFVALCGVVMTGILAVGGAGLVVAIILNFLGFGS